MLAPYSQLKNAAKREMVTLTGVTFLFLPVLGVHDEMFAQWRRLIWPEILALLVLGVVVTYADRLRPSVGAAGMLERFVDSMVLLLPYLYFLYGIWQEPGAWFFVLSVAAVWSVYAWAILPDWNLEGARVRGNLRHPASGRPVEIAAYALVSVMLLIVLVALLVRAIGDPVRVLQMVHSFLPGHPPEVALFGFGLLLSAGVTATTLYQLDRRKQLFRNAAHALVLVK